MIKLAECLFGSITFGYSLLASLSSSEPLITVGIVAGLLGILRGLNYA